MANKGILWLDVPCVGNERRRKICWELSRSRQGEGRGRFSPSWSTRPVLQWQGASEASEERAGTKNSVFKSNDCLLSFAVLWYLNMSNAQIGHAGSLLP